MLSSMVKTFEVNKRVQVTKSTFFHWVKGTIRGGFYGFSGGSKK